MTYILHTLQDPELMKLLYPEDTDQIRNDRIQHLLDLYLNMPDNIEKGVCMVAYTLYTMKLCSLG